MSDSNRIKVAAKVESVIGTAPAGAYQQINLSSCSLGAQKATAEENTVRDDRNLRGLIMTSLRPQGGFAFDWIYGNLDTFIPGIMGNALSAPVSLAGVDATVSLANTITADAGTPFSVCATGQWLAIVYGGIKYVVRVVSIGGSGASIVTSGATLVNGAVTLTTVKGKYVRNGTTMLSYSIEKNFADLSTKGFYMHRGMVPNTFGINAQAEAIVTGDLQFMGLNADTPTDATGTGGAYTAAVTTESMAGLSGDMGLFVLGGTIVTPSAAAIRAMNFSLNNNVRVDAAINTADMGWGQATVTGQISTFLKAGMTVIDQFFAHTSSSLSYTMKDSAGNIAVITILNLKFGNFSNQVGGKNQAVMGDLDFTGILDSTYNATLQIDLLDA